MANIAFFGVLSVVQTDAEDDVRCRQRTEQLRHFGFAALLAEAVLYFALEHLDLHALDLSRRYFLCQVTIVGLSVIGFESDQM